jgi:hypothetical protein
MGNIGKSLGIKSSRSLEKHIKKVTDKDVMVIKMSDNLRVIWAMDNELKTYNIKAHVIYILKDSDIDECVDEILKSLLK